MKKVIIILAMVVAFTINAYAFTINVIIDGVTSDNLKSTYVGLDDGNTPIIGFDYTDNILSYQPLSNTDPVNDVLFVCTTIMPPGSDLWANNTCEPMGITGFTILSDYPQIITLYPTNIATTTQTTSPNIRIIGKLNNYTNFYNGMIIQLYDGDVPRAATIADINGNFDISASPYANTPWSNLNIRLLYSNYTLILKRIDVLTNTGNNPVEYIVLRPITLPSELMLVINILKITAGITTVEILSDDRELMDKNKNNYIDLSDAVMILNSLVWH